MRVAAGWLALVPLLLLGSRAAGQTRVAVLSSPSASVAALVPLVELRLAEQPGIVLLDREHLAAVLREHELAGLTDAAGSAKRVALGELLKAELLIFIQQEDGPQPQARVVISETQQGLRLGHQTVACAASVADSVPAVMQIVDAALAKQRQQVKEIVAVPPLVSNDLAFESQSLQRPLASVIEQSLLARPDVLAVELAEANAVARELAVRGEKDVQRKLPLYVLGEFQHQGHDVAVRLRLLRGQALVHEATINDIPPARLAEVLRREANALLDQVVAPAVQAVESATEARQLAERAVAMYQLMNFSETLELAEASLLLAPDQVDVHRLAAVAAGMHVSFLLRKAAEEPGVWDVEQLKQNVRRDNEATLRRGLPHLEYYMTHAALVGMRDRALIFGYFEWCPGIVDVSPMMLRVLAAKRQGNVHDDTILFLRSFRQWCLGGMHADALVRWKLAVAREWPRVDDQGIVNLADVLLHGTDGRETPEVRAIIEQTRSLDHPPCQRAVAFIEARWKLGLSGIPEVAGDRPPPLRPPVAGGPTVEFVSRGVSAGMCGWLPVGDAGYVAWNGERLFAAQEPRGEDLRSVAGICASEDGVSVTFDGRHVWAFQNARDVMPDEANSSDRGPRLLVWDPETAKRWFLTATEGLPPIELRNVSFAPIDVGKVCVVGHFGEQRMTRVWMAMAQLDPTTGTGTVKMFHEARIMPPARFADEWKDTHLAFSRSRLATLVEPNAAAPRRRIVVDRFYGYPLLIDPDKPEAQVSSGEIRYRRPGFPVAHDGSLFWLGEKGPGDYRVCRFGFPDFMIHWGEHRVPPGLLATHRQGLLIVDHQGDVWVSTRATEPFRRLRTVYPEGRPAAFPNVKLFPGNDGRLFLYDTATSRLLEMMLPGLAD
jgi:hypothetical protein